MKTFHTACSTLLLAGLWAVPATAQQTADEVAALLATADAAKGEALYAENCASCHGENLQGQENWRTRNAEGQLPAPPHDKTGHTWHHPDVALFAYSKLGGGEFLKTQGIDNFNSGMPGFGELLDDQSIADILAFIKTSWPDREREMQASRSKQ